jgi:dTDP-4-amino-4,6-dideoxygalactose transaminase
MSGVGEQDPLSESVRDLVNRYKLPKAVFVTQPRMPRLEDYTRDLEQIWESRWLTNDGPFHKKFEKRLAEYLRVEYVNVFCNGTIALLVALQALRINSGEVITTPFTFPATAHVLHWNGIQPVFCDIDEKTYNLDPGCIERLISPNTKALLPVHVYGTPCDVIAIQEIADRHGLHVLYDAAHAMGVRLNGRPLVDYGDISMLSFHATKLFTTLEGGALVVGSEVQKTRINFLKNFGFADQETIIGPGINGKMNEMQAAFGLLQLDMIEEEIAGRGRLTRIYRSRLASVPGLTLLEDAPGAEHNNAYFPILIDTEIFGMSRDTLHIQLQEFNVMSRKYFYPLASRYSCYSALPSSRPENLPVAERVAKEVLCLPLYGTLDDDVVETICTILRELHRVAAER